MLLIENFLVSLIYPFVSVDNSPCVNVRCLFIMFYGVSKSLLVVEKGFSSGVERERNSQEIHIP